MMLAGICRGGLIEGMCRLANAHELGFAVEACLKGGQAMTGWLMLMMLAALGGGGVSEGMCWVADAHGDGLDLP